MNEFSRHLENKCILRTRVEVINFGRRGLRAVHTECVAKRCGYKRSVNVVTEVQCAVVWYGSIGYRFDVKCGGRQGGVLSPYLFSIYVDDLINELRHSGHGMHVDMVFMGCILYADDIVLLSGSCSGLQKWLTFAAIMVIDLI